MSDISHGGSIVLDGTFASKATAAPTIWDDCSGTNVLDKWDGFWPTGASSADYDMAYRATIRGIGMPHSRASKYICGCAIGGDAFTGNNVMFWKARTASFPSYSYFSYYFRCDDNWTFGLGSPGDDNFKLWDYSTGTSPYGFPANWYFEYNPRMTSSSSTDQTFHLYDDELGQSDQSLDGDGSAWWGTDGGMTNPMGGAWLKHEVEIKWTDQADGYVRFWENNVLQKSYTTHTDLYAGTDRVEAIGGFVRSHDANNYMYWGGIYYDRFPMRVVLINNATYASATIVEPLIPTAWSTTQITATVNAGALSNGTVWAAYVPGGGVAPTVLGSFNLTDGGGGPASTATLMPQIAL